MEYDFNKEIIVTEEEVEVLVPVGQGDPLSSDLAIPTETTEFETLTEEETEVLVPADQGDPLSSDLAIPTETTEFETLTEEETEVLVPAGQGDPLSSDLAIVMRLDCIIAILLIFFALTSIKKWFRGYSYAKRN